MARHWCAQCGRYYEGDTPGTLICVPKGPCPDHPEANTSVDKLNKEATLVDEETPSNLPKSEGGCPSAPLTPATTTSEANDESAGGHNVSGRSGSFWDDFGKKWAAVQGDEALKRKSLVAETECDSTMRNKVEKSTDRLKQPHVNDKKPDNSSSSAENPSLTDTQSELTRRLYDVSELIEDYDCVVLAQAPDKIIIRLASKIILSAASKVFKAQIKPYTLKKSDPIRSALEVFEFNTQKIKWILDLNLYSAESQEILKILHFEMDESLCDISWKRLIDITRFCEKYELQRALLPWHKLWIEKYERFTLHWGYEDWLYVTAVFDSDKGVDGLMVDLIDRCHAPRASEDGSVDTCEMIDCDGVDFDNLVKISTGLWPPERLAQILSFRRRKVLFISAVFKQFRDILMPAYSKPSAHTLCHSKKCISLSYGYFIGRTHEEELSDIFDGIWNRSVSELRSKAVKIATFETWSSVDGKHCCSIGIAKAKFRELVGYQVLDDVVVMGAEESDDEWLKLVKDRITSLADHKSN